MQLWAYISGKSLVPMLQLISRAINHLFPIEIQATQPDNNESEVTSNESDVDLNGNSRPLRKAADQARKKISGTVK